MTDEQVKILMEDAIVESIRRAPEADVPEGFSTRVMGGLSPKTPSVWTRIYLWLNRPQVMTVRPFHAIPVLTLAVALLAFAFIQTRPVQNEEDLRLATVRFVMYDGEMLAQNVSVVGSFNGWKADRSVMWYSVEAGAWMLEAQLPPGDHEYLFLVNGDKLMPDPLAPLTRDDGFGNVNSIMFVVGDNEQAL
ncbi:glycogen-binding domain-containing protein [uncultured Pseudodesulfovibrio sp.]|uniref:glycogen-binding domain-containing protein n=1 Tax=uncultured Pseudodesulfovibrio sp. TaxID=2035858 RepID=UPI0029C8595F|nr:glycogen-binding domain-containing protein [uncultured Pseudodesulfovibrio sp.]